MYRRHFEEGWGDSEGQKQEGCTLRTIFWIDGGGGGGGGRRPEGLYVYVQIKGVQADHESMTK